MSTLLERITPTTGNLIDTVKSRITRSTTSSHSPKRLTLRVRSKTSVKEAKSITNRSPVYQKTLVIIKQETLGRGLAGRITQRFEDKGLKILALKMITPTMEQAKMHYRGDNNWKIKVGVKTIENINQYIDVRKALGTTDALEIGERVYQRSVENLSKGPIIIMVLGGENAIDEVKKISGSSTPIDSAPGTIRGDYATDSYLSSHQEKRSIFNVIHRSTDPEEASHEIGVWFKPDEVYD